MNKKRCYIFDIDGTLANAEHRLHFIEVDANKAADWPAFFDACDQDTPIPHMIELADNLALFEPILFVTGRSETVRGKTHAWLCRHIPEGRNLIGDSDLYMRKADDKRADTIVKSELLDQILAQGWLPIMTFEDRASVVNMWRERGIPCCQVAPGNF